MRSVPLLGMGILLSLSVHAAETKLPEGVVLYWNCDDDAGFSWRDNHWQTGGSPRITYDTQQRKHGKAALRIDGVEGEELRVVSLTQPAPVKPGDRYVLRFWARTDGIEGQALVRVLAHGPRTVEKSYDPLGWVRLSPKVHYFLPAQSDWTLHEVPIRQLPDGTARLFIYLVVKGAGTAWFDEVAIAREGVTVPLGGVVELTDRDYAGVRFDDNQLPANLLKNGDFEKGSQHWSVAANGSTAKVEGVAGGHALRPDAVEFTGAYVYQRMRIDPRRRYRLSLRARTDAKGLTGYFFTQILRFDRHGAPFGWAGADHASEFTYVTGKTNGWVERHQEFSLTPNTDSIVLYLRVQDTIGAVWVDDVRLVALPLRVSDSPSEVGEEHQ